MPSDRFLDFFALQTSQAEIDELGLAVAGEQHVGQLEIAMGDALLQRIVQACHHAFHDVGGFQRIESPPRAIELAEVLALDELHHEVVRQTVRIHLVDFDDVRVLELACRFPLRGGIAR